MTSVQPALDHAHAHRDAYLEGFTDLLRIPSISTDPAFAGDVRRCAEWLTEELTRIGFKNCQVLPSAGHPVVYGEWLEAGPDKPTVLMYAHYDVQPVDPLDLWETPPFEPTIRDGRLYARGAVDDKSGVWVNLKALESIMTVEGKLPVNVKLFFEGEEETGSPNMGPFVAEHRDLLTADLLVLCDGGFEPAKPTICYAARGIVSMEVSITGPDHDLHSGIYGGVVYNPLHLAGKIIGSFHDEYGRIQLPGFYDAVTPLTDDEKRDLAAAWAENSAVYTAKSGATHYFGDAIAPIAERASSLPTLDVNGVWGGYAGPGTKTVIPSQAGFKVTMRLVSDQNPDAIAALFSEYVTGFSNELASVEVKLLSRSFPFRALREGAGVEAVQSALEAVIGKRAVLERTGGSIPIGGMFQRQLGIPMTHFGLGGGDNIHSPNEYIRMDDFYRAIDAAIHFYYNAASLE